MHPLLQIRCCWRTAATVECTFSLNSFRCQPQTSYLQQSMRKVRSLWGRMHVIPARDQLPSATARSYACGHRHPLMEMQESPAEDARCSPHTISSGGDKIYMIFVRHIHSCRVHVFVRHSTVADVRHKNRILSPSEAKKAEIHSSCRKSRGGELQNALNNWNSPESFAS